MKKVGVIMATAVACVALAACGNSQHQDASADKVASSRRQAKAEKMSAAKQKAADDKRAAELSSNRAKHRAEKAAASGQSRVVSTPKKSPQETNITANYTAGFEPITVPSGMRGTWFGYEPYSDNMTTIVFGATSITRTGKKRALYNGNVRTAEDETARHASNGGSAEGPRYTAGDRYRMENWVESMFDEVSGKHILQVGSSWYPSDVGTSFYLEGRYLKTLEGATYARTQDEAEKVRPVEE